MTGNGLVLVETGAHRLGGHRHRTLVALTQAHTAARESTAVAAPNGIADETRTALATAGARLITPTGIWTAAAAGVGVVAAAGRRTFASRRWPQRLRRAPHQVTLLARCLTEVACIRAGRRWAGPDAAAVVVLSGSEALHGLAGLLGGSHIRFVHEVVTTEDAPIRLIGRLARRGERRVLVLAPTRAIRNDLTRRFPGLRVQVRPFAVAGPGDRIAAPERQRARNRFGIDVGETAVCLVGGWWPYKDIDVINAALADLDAPLHVLVAGAPLDHDRLRRWDALPHVILHVVPGPASEADIRAVYAASDAVLVARRPGVAKESGLVVDAVRLGVPLIASDHDPALVCSLTGQDWARVFPAGDATALTGVLRDLIKTPLPPPTAAAAAVLDVPTGAEQIAFLTGCPAKESSCEPTSHLP